MATPIAARPKPALLQALARRGSAPIPATKPAPLTGKPNTPTPIPGRPNTHPTAAPAAPTRGVFTVGGKTYFTSGTGQAGSVAAFTGNAGNVTHVAAPTNWQSYLKPAVPGMPGAAPVAPSMPAPGTALPQYLQPTTTPDFFHGGDQFDMTAAQGAGGNLEDSGYFGDVSGAKFQYDQDTSPLLAERDKLMAGGNQLYNTANNTLHATQQQRINDGYNALAANGGYWTGNRDQFQKDENGTELTEATNLSQSLGPERVAQLKQQITAKQTAAQQSVMQALLAAYGRRLGELPTSYGTGG